MGDSSEPDDVCAIANGQLPPHREAPSEIVQHSGDLKRKSADDSVNIEEAGSSTFGLHNTSKRQKLRHKLWPSKRIRKATEYAQALLTGNGRKPKFQPTNAVTVASLNKKTTDKYHIFLRGLSTDKPTTKQLEGLDKARASVPNYLGRAAAIEPGFAFGQWNRATNGLTTPNLFMPAVDAHINYRRHTKLQDLSQGEHTYMLALHLMWYDMPTDAYLSYSNSLIFLIVHALNRHNEGQGPTTIQFLDTREAETTYGAPADIFPALTLYDTFNLPAFRGSSKGFAAKLCVRKFTHEFLSFGTLMIRDNKFQQVTVETLERAGLYELKPELQIPENHRHGTLYGTQVYLRRSGYPASYTTSEPHPQYSYTDCARQIPFTESVLLLAARLARNFVKIPDGEDPETYKPHLYAFLLFLVLDKRPKRDPIFIQWIKDHYTAEDVKDLYEDETGGMRPGFNLIPANLPENMQYFDLIDDANFASGLPDLPAMEIVHKHELTGEDYVAEDARLQSGVKRSTLYDAGADRERKNKLRKRRAKKTGPAQGCTSISPTPEQIQDQQE